MSQSHLSLWHLISFSTNVKEYICTAFIFHACSSGSFDNLVISRRFDITMQSFLYYIIAILSNDVETIHDARY
jgi:hypothetical protein